MPPKMQGAILLDNIVEYDRNLPNRYIALMSPNIYRPGTVLNGDTAFKEVGDIFPH